MFKVVKEVNPVEAATESYVEPTENTSEDDAIATEAAVDEEAMAMEAYAYSDELNDEIMEALESIFFRTKVRRDPLTLATSKVHKRTFRSRLTDRVRKKIFRIKSLRDLEKFDKAISKEIGAYNEAMSEMRSAANDFSVNKINKFVMRGRIQTAQNRLKRSLKILSLGDFGANKTSLTNDDIKNLKTFLIDVKLLIKERKDELTSAKAPSTEGRTCGKACEGENCDESDEECDDDDEECDDEDCEDDDDEEISEGYADYVESLIGSESIVEKPLTRSEFKLAINSKKVKSDPNLKAAIMSGSYTKSKLEKMGILRPASEACGKKKKDTSNIMTSKDEKEEKKKKAVEAFNTLLATLGLDDEEDYEEATEARGAKLETTWKVKNGLLRKEAAAQKKQASKFVSKKNYDEALKCLKGAKVSLNSLKDHVNGLTMAEYKDITPGKGESDDAFDNFVAKQLDWVEGEINKIDDYADTVRDKMSGKATESVELTEDMMLDIAFESVMCCLEADDMIYNEDAALDSAFESVITQLAEAIDEDEEQNVNAAFESLIDDYTNAVLNEDEDALLNLNYGPLMESLGIEPDAEPDYTIEESDEVEEDDTDDEEEEVTDEAEINDDYDEATEAFLDLEILNMDADLDLELALMQ